MEKIIIVLALTCLAFAAFFGLFLVVENLFFQGHPSEGKDPSLEQSFEKAAEPSIVRSAVAVRKDHSLLKEKEEASVTNICGRVISQAGKPLSNVRILLTQEGLPFPSAEQEEPFFYFTKPSGEFSIRDLVPGKNCTLYAAMDGCQMAFVPNIIVEKMGVTKRVPDIVLKPGAKVSGQVSDTQGCSIPGAIIRPALPIPRIPFETDRLKGFYPQAHAKPNGTYALSSLSSGKIMLEASAPGFLSESRSLSLSEGEGKKGIDFVLKREMAISGIVKDKGGAPVKGAKISCRRQDKEASPSLLPSPESSIENEILTGGVISFFLNQVSISENNAPPEPPPAVFPSRKQAESREKGSARSDENGRFTVKELSEGPYRVHVEAEGFVWNTLDYIPAGEENLQVVLTPTGTVLGTVKCADTGKPVERFSITEKGRRSANLILPEPEDFTNSVGTFSDPDGRFSIHSLQPGKYALKIVADGFASHRTDEIEILPESSLDLGIIFLQKAASISGRVFSQEDTTPLEGVKIAIKRKDRRQKNFFVFHIDGIGGESPPQVARRAKTATDSEGFYELSSLDPGTYTVEAVLSGYTLGKQENILLTYGQKLEGLDFFLARGGTITGHVYDVEGSPIQSTKILARSSKLGSHSATTDKDGLYAFKDLIPGTYSLYRQNNNKGNQGTFVLGIQLDMDEQDSEGGMFAGGEKVKLEPGQTLVLDFIVGKPCTIQGTVKCENIPLPPCTVTLQPKKSITMFSSDLSSPVDESNTYTIKEVESGVYTISVKTKDGSILFRKKITIPPQPEYYYDISLLLGSLSGTVRTPSGSPVPDVSLKIGWFKTSSSSEDSGRNEVQEWMGNIQQKTDSEGRYTFSCLPPGDYTISATKKNFSRATTRDIHLDEGETLNGIDITLKPGGSINVTVVDEETGRPIPFCFITVEGNNEKETANTDQSGKTMITGLPPGVYKLTGESLTIALFGKNQEYEKKESFVNVESGKASDVTLILSPVK